MRQLLERFMKIGRLSRPAGLSRLLISILLLTAIALTPKVSAEDVQKSERFMSRSVKNISPEKAIQYITEAKLGTASRIPNTQTILVTTDSADLSKARTLLEIVDSTEPYTVVLLPADQNIVTQVQQGSFAGRLTDLSIGSFANPPIANEKPKVLVDLLGDSVIIAAPTSRLDEVTSALLQTPPQSPESNLPPVAETPPAGLRSPRSGC